MNGRSLVYVAVVVVGLSQSSSHSFGGAAVSTDYSTLTSSFSDAAIVITPHIDSQRYVSAVQLVRTEEPSFSVANSGFANSIGLSLVDALTRVRDQLDASEHATAAAAIKDGVSLVSQFVFQIEPWVGISDGGFAMMQWRVGHKGLILVFSGDGSVTFSTASATANYSESPAEYLIGNNSALTISSAIKDLFS